MDSKPKGLLFLIPLLVAALPLFSLGLSNHGLWTPDEPRVAEIGREMALNGNWAVPTLNGRPFLEHPPLYYASMAAVFKTFGVSEGAARLPSAVFALAGICAIFFLAGVQFSPRIGFLSAFVLATSAEYFRVGNWAIVDSALSFFIYLALLCFWAAHTNQNQRKRLVFYGLCYVFCTLAFYVKGFVGIALPGAAVLFFLVSRRDPKEVLRMHLWLGVLIFAVMTFPWFLSLYRQGGMEFLKVFLLHNHFERFAGGSTGHNQPFYYYLTQFPVGFLPWSLLVVPAAAWSFRKKTLNEGSKKEALLFAKCWFIAGFVLLSMASTKRILYLMPLFAPAAIIVGCYMESTLDRSMIGWFERFFAYLFGLALLLTALTPIFLNLYAPSYGVPVSRNAFVYLLPFSVAAFVFSFLGLWNFGRDRKRFWLLTGASLLCLCLLALLGVVPLFDQHKNFLPFSREVTHRVPGVSRLYAYKPDETIRGAIPFYTNRYLTEIDTLDQLKTIITGERKVFVIIRDSKGRLKREIETVAPFSLLTSQSMGLNRSLSLYVLE